MSKNGTIRNVANCYRRGKYAGEAFSTLADLPHEIQEGDRRRVSFALRRADGNLQDLVDFTTRRDTAAAKTIRKKIATLVKVLDNKKVSKQAKIMAARSVIDDMGILQSRIGRSCNVIR